MLGYRTAPSVDVVLLHKSLRILVGVIGAVEQRSSTETIVFEVVGPGGRDEFLEQIGNHTQVKLDVLVIVSTVHYVLELW